MLIELMLLMVHDASILCPAKKMQGVINFFGWICILINQNTQAFHIFMTALLQNIIHIVREGRKSDAINGVISVDGMEVKYDAEMEKKEEKMFVGSTGTREMQRIHFDTPAEKRYTFVVAATSLSTWIAFFSGSAAAMLTNASTTAGTVGIFLRQLYPK
ncbi:uncharacterized protein LOC111301205 isoform X2 [Durio zibethinus]|uniref:Uncharacterized protein LOC111301205 isoform X2 n=1 Tax=Durio zibethinus TaxID=66656 RepID=A0A6P5ZI80_DURZI|nr:uncharacterized protein LOC111301205 isoform X2 [Durio zibethinus]